MFASRAALRHALTGTALIAALAASSVPASAQVHPHASVESPAASADDGHDYEAVVPIVKGWYNGEIALYISTDSSRVDVAHATGTNYVARLAKAIDAGAVDDIYQFTNFKQGNVIPSAPTPAGWANTDPSYTPLWQLSLVTWVAGKPRTLKSEAEVLAERAAGHVTIQKTTIVINCPVFYTPQGHLLQGIRIVR